MLTFRWRNHCTVIYSNFFSPIIIRTVHNFRIVKWVQLKVEKEYNKMFMYSVWIISISTLANKSLFETNKVKTKLPSKLSLKKIPDSWEEEVGGHSIAGSIKILALFVFPSHKKVMLNFTRIVGNSDLYEWSVGRCEFQPGLIMWLCWPSISLSHDWCRLGTAPTLSYLAGIVAFLNWVLSIVSSVPRIAVTWTCDQLDWFSLIIINFIDTYSPFIRTQWERE
jgi:hypothetical protein